MFWWIFLGVSGGLMILGIIFWCIYEFASVYLDVLGMCGMIMTVIFGFATLCSGIIVPVCYTQYKQEIAVFEQQKYYIEEVVPTLPETDNYAITIAKIDLNEWLYNAQYSVNTYGIFSLYPPEVLELEEIK